MLVGGAEKTRMRKPCLLAEDVATRGCAVRAEGLHFSAFHVTYLGATGHNGAYFGPGSGPIHLDYVVCSGTEYNLTDCQVGKRTRQSSHSEDVGVKCQTSKNMLQDVNSHNNYNET